MIYTSQIYDTLLTAIRKDKRGLSFSPDDFNNIIVQVNQRIFRLNYAGFESSKLSMDEMDSFKKVNVPINLDTNGIGILPSDYYHLVGDPYYMHPTFGRRRVDLITSLEHGQREMDYLTKASITYPTTFMAYGATSEDMSLYVTPTTCTPIYIDYLRKVTTPFLDYYVDTNLNIIYMAEGATVAIPLGSTSRSGVSGMANVVSLTKNFEWHEHDIPQIINLLLGTVGIALPDEGLVQIAEADEPKIERG
jgi:hypothetical protein